MWKQPKQPKDKSQSKFSKEEVCKNLDSNVSGALEGNSEALNFLTQHIRFFHAEIKEIILGMEPEQFEYRIQTQIHALKAHIHYLDGNKEQGDLEAEKANDINKTITEEIMAHKSLSL